jgi:hypothetical protein
MACAAELWETYYKGSTKFAYKLMACGLGRLDLWLEGGACEGREIREVIARTVRPNVVQGQHRGARSKR